jgi:hypothetical protein
MSIPADIEIHQHARAKRRVLAANARIAWLANSDDRNLTNNSTLSPCRRVPPGGRSAW